MKIEFWVGNCRSLYIVTLVGLVLSQSSCSDIRGALGYDKRAPDEFSVVTRAPLSVPPNFGLRPPQPGVKRPQEFSRDNKVKSSILKVKRSELDRGLDNKGHSDGDQTIRKLLGTTQSNPDIRQLIEKEKAAVVSDETLFMDKLLFWRSDPQPGVVVDANKEKRRLQTNASSGKSVTDGDTPIVEKKQRGLFDGLLEKLF